MSLTDVYESLLDHPEAKEVLDNFGTYDPVKRYFLGPYHYYLKRREEEYGILLRHQKPSGLPTNELPKEDC